MNWEREFPVMCTVAVVVIASNHVDATYGLLIFALLTEHFYITEVTG